MLSVIWATGLRVATVLGVAAGVFHTWMALADRLNPLVMFTVQSNLLLAGYCCWRVFGRRRASAEVEGAVTLYIVATGLVWHFLRMRGANPFEYLSLADHSLGNVLLLHRLVTRPRIAAKAPVPEPVE